MVQGIDRARIIELRSMMMSEWRRRRPLVRKSAAHLPSLRTFSEASSMLRGLATMTVVLFGVVFMMPCGVADEVAHVVPAAKSLKLGELELGCYRTAGRPCRLRRHGFRSECESCRRSESAQTQPVPRRISLARRRCPNDPHAWSPGVARRRMGFGGSRRAAAELDVRRRVSRCDHRCPDHPLPYGSRRRTS